MTLILRRGFLSNYEIWPKDVVFAEPIDRLVQNMAMYICFGRGHGFGCAEGVVSSLDDVQLPLIVQLVQNIHEFLQVTERIPCAGEKKTSGFLLLLPLFSGQIAF